MKNYGFSINSMKIRPSITHGTKARITEINKNFREDDQVIDLSIGTLDEKTNYKIDNEVIEFIRNSPEMIHEFAPVKGFNFLRESISLKVERLRGIYYLPQTEILVTPGGIKGAITVIFHAFLNPGEEVIVPIPNWPHYADMIELHGADIKSLYTADFRNQGLTPEALNNAINDKTKMIILGDCVNPSGKIYSAAELEEIARIIAWHNMQREANGMAQIHILFDCPYEAHILDERPATISSMNIKLDNGRSYSMKECTSIVTGPGKTYGMHGDRIGYICSNSVVIEMLEKVQVNLNSFASTYGQVATHAALKLEMDLVATERAKSSREKLKYVLKLLNEVPGIDAPTPDGGYFGFINFTALKILIQRHGYSSAEEFLIEEAKVATISGRHFAMDIPEMDFYVRLNCGRSKSILEAAVKRIKNSVTNMTENSKG